MAFLWKIMLNPKNNFPTKSHKNSFFSKRNVWIEPDFPEECHFLYLLVFHACFYLDTFWSCELFHFSGRPTLPGIDAGEMKKLAAPKSVRVKTGIK